MVLFVSEHLYDSLCHCPVELPGLLTNRLDVSGREQEPVPSQQTQQSHLNILSSSHPRHLPPSVPQLHREGEGGVGDPQGPVRGAPAGHVEDAGDAADPVLRPVDSLQSRDASLRHRVLRGTVEDQGDGGGGGDGGDGGDTHELHVVVRRSAGVAPGEED